MYQRKAVEENSEDGEIESGESEDESIDGDEKPKENENGNFERGVYATMTKIAKYHNSKIM